MSGKQGRYAGGQKNQGFYSNILHWFSLKTCEFTIYFMRLKNHFFNFFLAMKSLDDFKFHVSQQDFIN